jgi:hypothetical protein
MKSSWRSAFLITMFSMTMFALSSADIVTSAAEMNGIMMSGEKMMLVHAGKKDVPLTREMIMSDGTKVEPDGVLLLKDGSKSRLQNGEMIMMDGHIMRGGKPVAMCH